MPPGYKGMLISCADNGEEPHVLSSGYWLISTQSCPRLLGALPWYLLRDNGCCQVDFFWCHVGTFYWIWTLPLLCVKIPVLWDFLVTKILPEYQTPQQSSVTSQSTWGLVDLLQESKGYGRQEVLTQALPLQNRTKPLFLCHCSCPWLVCDVSPQVPYEK